MDAKHQFKYSYQGGCEDFSPVDITFEVPGDSSLSQMLYNFQSYLKACGFVFDGELEIVDHTFDVMKDQDDIDEIYGCMADWDKNVLDESEGSDEDDWDKICQETEDKANQKLKEWNEGIARLDNEQKQKCREEALKMSKLHDEAIKEVAKNNWVHGICNPPSPDWKATN